MRFEHWDPLHFIILFLTAFLGLGLPYTARKFASPKIKNMIGFILGVILLLNYCIYVIYRIDSGYWQVRYDLPMEFCNWSAIVTSLALFTRNRTLAELSYFWVIAGSMQGVITPDLSVTFPHIYFFIFFIAHSGLVISALYVVFGLELTPRKGAVLRSVLYTQIYVVTALVIDFALDANYGYMREKSAAGSLMDYLGPWPIYILWMQALGMILFTLLYLPFWKKNLREES
ncbi:TIGR02206 family membrane protein [Leptospira licerasiae]|uniref:TIGR02206 family protein n=1 Tax=Leptospira licerasiae str. MMD4847 TaxID=1049971 RepID=A0ABN0HB09_9LEPT|nr:TIGR02206 family membrane protein [Leptospira licerasiae]EIE02255.1 TIGR02206 family protein [Leptospira licerasiae serovar Varillal str. VAR 010]EJZ42901.1 TIGR02206 family protein [Leptospira licerasiae str. MMD4847]